MGLGRWLPQDRKPVNASQQTVAGQAEKTSTEEVEQACQNRNVNNALLCRIGGGVILTDAGFARIRTTAISARGGTFICQKRRKTGEEKGQEGKR